MGRGGDTVPGKCRRYHEGEVKMQFGIVPPEPPANRELAPLPDVFESRIGATLASLSAHGAPSILREGKRSPERQAWLYGFGRLYDDGRGRVTNAKSGLYSWHGFWLAGDIVEAEREDNAPTSYWRLLRDLARSNGLASGMDWPDFTDPPHVQPRELKRSPSNAARILYAAGGLSAVWRAVRMDHK